MIGQCKEFIADYLEHAFPYFPEDVIEIGMFSVSSDAALRTFRSCGYGDDYLDPRLLLKGCEERDIERVLQAIERYYDQEFYSF